MELIVVARLKKYLIATPIFYKRISYSRGWGCVS